MLSRQSNPASNVRVKKRRSLFRSKESNDPPPPHPTSNIAASSDAISRTLSSVSANAMNSIKLISPSVSKLPATLAPSPSAPAYDLVPNGHDGISKKDQMVYTASHSRSPTVLPVSQPNTERPSLPTSQTLPAFSNRTVSNSLPAKASPSLPIAEDGSTKEKGNSEVPFYNPLGKAGQTTRTGEVIDRLSRENDKLRRDNNSEKANLLEAKEEVKNMRTKMENMVAEFETKLHDASVAQTLLKRRDRQLADMQAQLDRERVRAEAASQSEQEWKRIKEESVADCKQKVEEATARAMLHEGRINLMTKHWKDQGEEVDSKVSTLRVEISAMLKDRQEVCTRMDRLNQMCEQQAHQLVSLEDQKNAIAQAFEAYKQEQESMLVGIKERAAHADRTNNATIAESKKVLGDLKWALAVKKNLRDD